MALHLWHGIDKVDLTFGDLPNGVIRNFVAVRDLIFVVTTSGNLYHGEVKRPVEEASSSVTLKRADFSVVDVAANSTHLFIVNDRGHVLKVDPQSLEVIETIVLKDEVKFCSHGYKKEAESVRVKTLSVSDTATLFVTETGELWASGSQPQIDINSPTPQKVIFFQGRASSSISCGKKFSLAVARKIPRAPQDDTDSEEAECDEIFVASCPQCVKAPPASPQSISSDSVTPGSPGDAASTCNPPNAIVNGHLSNARKNAMFINTEAARQFLTRQLSWVSSYGDGEATPRGLLKQNVSNMASLVFEGVRTMGDKVATLSRHMSGSSEIDREDVLGDFEHLDTRAASLRLEEFPWSSSTASLDHEMSQQGLNERVNALADMGNGLLSAEVWAWGDGHQGQLGTGDIIRRPKPVLVTKLQHAGVKKVVCGAEHVLALTLDGRAFAWGSNDAHQAAPDDSASLSSPSLVAGVAEKRARDVAAGAKHSLVVVSEEAYFLGNFADKVRLDIAKGEFIKFVACSGAYSACSTVLASPPRVTADLHAEQRFLEETLVVHAHLIRPFQKKGAATSESNVYDTVCRCYIELMSLTALNVKSLAEYSAHAAEAYDVTMVASAEEFVAVYRYFLSAVCDVISLGGFAHMGKIMGELPQALIRMFDEKDKKEAVAAALQSPLRKLGRYRLMIENLMKSNGGNMGVERLQEALVKWERLHDDQEKRLQEAEATKVFWESSGKLVELLRSPERRLIRESRTSPISVLNCSRFSSHWFILLTDIFIHVVGTSHTAHPLPTLWIEPLTDSDTANSLSVTGPEDSLILYTATATERHEWLQALQNAVNASLHRTAGHAPPRDRTSTYVFLKHALYKDAKYTGRWSSGKPHGFGKIEWADGRLYSGQFNKGIIHGSGRMEVATLGIYEGQWKDGLQNGYGTFKYINGDVYEGYFKDGLPHGHGMKKDGHFMASVATMYIGEWAAGVKQGYGVMDDIMTGEKYLGLWSNNMKHGCGLIVTLDGIYYEGVFAQDVLMGHGVMMFEDGTHYEGEFKSAGIFGGKGILTFPSGDKLEGNINGAWNEPVKITATLHINKDPTNLTTNKPASFGKLCVMPDQKWRAIFRQCYQQLGISNPTSNDRLSEYQRLWQNVAVIISKSQQCGKSMSGAVKNSNDHLNKIPQFGREKLTLSSFHEVHEYLKNAFDSRVHPLGALLHELATVYTATYGGVRVHPLLLSHAVSELHSIMARIYEIVVLLFPALPPGSKESILESDDKVESRVISAAAILYPIVLPRVHSALFVLYALHNKKEDDAYWERLIKWNKQPDRTLMALLDVDQKFCSVNSAMDECVTHFSEAIETLQQLKTTFSPLEKMLVIRSTCEQLTKTVQERLDAKYKWTMDDLFPVFNFVVIRASVLQLGSEIHFIEDFMEPYLQNGELGIMFTTLKACYCQILQEKMSMTD